MPREWMQTICQIGIFMLCARTISHFRPREAYEKYFKMLVGIMILVQMFLPFGKLFWGVDGDKLQAGVEQFQRKLEQSMEAAADQALVVEKQMEQMSMLQLQERMEEQEAIPEEGQEKSVKPVEIEVTIGQ